MALDRQEMPEEMEAEAARCNSLKTLSALAERNTEFCDTSMDLITPVKLLLELNEKKFIACTAGVQYELDALWTLLAIHKEFHVNHRK